MYNMSRGLTPKEKKMQKAFLKKNKLKKFEAPKDKHEPYSGKLEPKRIYPVGDGIADISLDESVRNYGFGRTISANGE